MKKELKPRDAGMKRRDAGYRNALRLEQQVAHLTELIGQQQQALADAHGCHMLLANAILLHRATHLFMHPLYQQWARQDDTSCTWHSHDARLLSQLPLVQSNPDWQLLLQIAAASSKVMKLLLSVTPEQVRTLARLSVEDAWQLTKECAHGMIMLSEMLLPARYPSDLLMPARHQRAAAQAGAQHGRKDSHAGGPADHEGPTASAAELTEAAQQLLTRLEQYQALINKMSVSVAVLMALQPTILIGLATMDLESGQHRSPPAGHFMRAASRLHLTGPQVTELLRIRDLSNRMVSQVRSKGMHLVGQVQNSFSLATNLSAAIPSALESSGQQACFAQQQQSNKVSQQQEQNDLEEVMLEHLQQHVHNLGDLIMVQGTWVANVLTPWQHGLFTAACWPFQARLGALVELAPLLKPDDSPPLQINDAVCSAAAAAAALGAELGYLGAQQAMQQRHDAMDVHLAWVLQELGSLQQ